MSRLRNAFVWQAFVRLAFGRRVLLRWGLPLGALVLGGCTPQYSEQLTAGFAADGRLVDRVDIQRQGNFRLQRSAKIYVAWPKDPVRDGEKRTQDVPLRVTELVQSGVAVAFPTMAGDSPALLPAALVASARAGADFLIYPELIAPLERPDLYDQPALKLVLQLYDLRAHTAGGRETAIDKITLTATAGWPGNGVKEQSLRDAVGRLARSLSGDAAEADALRTLDR